LLLAAGSMAKISILLMRYNGHGEHCSCSSFIGSLITATDLTLYVLPILYP
jgi:hypothetical protein